MRPYPTYEPSGVPWLGDLPANWALRKIRYLAPSVRTKVQGENVGARYIGLEHVQSGTGKFVEINDDLQTESESTVNVFYKGDVLFGKLRPYLAKSVVADTDGVCSSEFLVLRPEDGVESGYLNRALLMGGVIKTIDAATFGAKMPRADWRFIGELKLPVPTLDEQIAIADYLDTETARIDDLIREKDELIALLREAHAAAFSTAIARFAN